VFDELAAPLDLLNADRRPSVSATTPFLSVLQPTETDRVLAERGSADNLRIYKELLRDDQVHATWGQRRLALTSCETVVEPGAEDAASVLAAEELQAELDGMAWDDITDKALFALFYGWGVAEIMWRPDGDRVRFGRVVVRARERFRFDRQGRLYLWENGWRLMPERKFWVARAGADNHDDLYGLGLAHSLYWPVWFKRNGIKFWLVFLEKFGMPTAVAKMPAGKINDPAEVRKAKELLRQIATDAGVVIPDDVVVELLEAARSGAADYGAMHDAMDRAISKITVGQTMTTDDGSSRAQAQVHLSVRQDIVEADADLLCGSFNDGPVRWWCEWNHPNAVPPRVWRKTEPPEDLAKRAERDAKVYGLGFEPTEDYIRDTYGEGWQKRQAPAVDPLQAAVQGKPGQPGAAQFAEGELAALAALKAARRGDQEAISQAAAAFASQWDTITGRRVGQILQAADFAEDHETFRRRLDELLAEVPPAETADKLARGTFFARLAGAMRAALRSA
jgi:phage gp29-like protein